MTPWVGRLIALNVVVYVLQQLVPGLTAVLAMVPAFVLRPPWALWTLVTYMFVHGSIGHIFFNMFSLFVFGPRVEARLGAARFLRLYFVSGLAGAAVSLPIGVPIIGASAAVFGVTLAFARFWPRDQLLIWGVIPIEARWLVVLMTVLSLAGATGRFEPGVAHFAHLGGFLGGWLYLKWIERGRGKAEFNRPKRSSAAFLLDRDSASLSRWSRIPRDRLHEVNRAEVERLLAKINRSGIASLTPGERETLDRFAPGD